MGVLKGEISHTKVKEKGEGNGHKVCGVQDVKFDWSGSIGLGGIKQRVLG